MILEMGEELPILKGILNGVVKYHNARTFPHIQFFTNLIFFICTCQFGLNVKQYQEESLDDYCIVQHRSSFCCSLNSLI